MEIEAKFTVPDRGTFDQLQTLRQIGGYSVKEPATHILTDRYLDTAQGLILRGGYACRLRQDHSRDTWTGTLKGLGGSQGALHQREELEVPITPNAPPGQWPESPARALALRLSLNHALAERLIVYQKRHTRSLYLGRRRVAELSLDEVEFHAGDKRLTSHELEIELKEAGAVDDLQALIGALSDYGWLPEPRSKFERGLALVENNSA